MSTETASPTPDTGPAIRSSLADFPHWLSPMLVKELRQGLRTNMFVTAFILLQLFMILCLLIAAASPESDESNGFFWFFVWVVLVFVQPLRGFGALSAEFRLKTIELLQLTRLDAWRIAFGKWTALNAQTLLLVVTVIPYLVMRYFLGGVNFVTDLGVVALLAVASAFLSAVAIGTSGFRSVLVRVVIAVIGFLILLNLGSMFAFSRLVGSSRSFEPESIALFLLTAGYGTYFFLTIGASRIAPRSENLAIRKRLGALVFAAVALGFHFLGLDNAPRVLAGLALALASVDALTEPLPLIPTVAKPFTKSILLRPFAYFFTPGWHTGLYFFVAAFFLWVAAFAVTEFMNLGSIAGSESEMWITLFALGGVVAFPLLLIHVGFGRRTDSDHHFGIYLFIQVGLLVVTLLCTIAAEASSAFENAVFVVLPIPSLLLVGLMENEVDGLYFGVASFLGFAVPLAVAWVKGRRPLRELGRSLRGKDRATIPTPPAQETHA